MKSSLKILLLAFILTSCLNTCRKKHLDEKIFRSSDITVKWYRVSEITTIHDFVDLRRHGWTRTIMRANTGGIYDILIEGDTITIQTTKNLLIYHLAAKTLGCHIKHDTSITDCQYIKKIVPENAKYHCEDTLQIERDTLKELVN